MNLIRLSLSLFLWRLSENPSISWFTDLANTVLLIYWISVFVSVDTSWQFMTHVSLAIFIFTLLAYLIAFFLKSCSFLFTAYIWQIYQIYIKINIFFVHIEIFIYFIFSKLYIRIYSHSVTSICTLFIQATST